MYWREALRSWREARREKRLLALERVGTGRPETAAECDGIVQPVLERFARSEFAGGLVRKTDPDTWELRHAGPGGEFVTDMKVQIDMEDGRPKGFTVAYYRREGMHLRPAALKPDSLAKAIRRCLRS